MPLEKWHHFSRSKLIYNNINLLFFYFDIIFIFQHINLNFFLNFLFISKIFKNITININIKKDIYNIYS